MNTISYQRDDIAEKYTGQIHVYSCRAECQQDALDFINILFQQSNRVMHVMMIPDARMPDTLLEVGFKEQCHEVLITNLENQEDSHVMLETLRYCPLSQNNLQRKYDPYPLLEKTS